ncbi:hypothetical protein SAMN05444411_102261 [Lutibacter oricola]|uniref:Thrombospondin type 3 repeat-containing protein n=1 Tax=Lutibacter oricola TaxID=762486 RepID=A0A1H2WQH5_9FLAO|nr:hypothetical protein [Lutibacter oricola]SDW82900.1 hypothetical protein SAMN05444411_102261 [Lutibacter oricola]
MKKIISIFLKLKVFTGCLLLFIGSHSVHAQDYDEFWDELNDNWDNFEDGDCFGDCDGSNDWDFDGDGSNDWDDTGNYSGTDSDFYDDVSYLETLGVPPWEGGGIFSQVFTSESGLQAVLVFTSDGNHLSTTIFNSSTGTSGEDPYDPNNTEPDPTDEDPCVIDPINCGEDPYDPNNTEPDPTDEDYCATNYDPCICDGDCGDDYDDSDTTCPPPNCDPDTQKVDATGCGCENLPDKNWFKDKDGDGYNEIGTEPMEQPNSPGDGWVEGVSKGEDCDDNEASKWKIYNGTFSQDITSIGIGGPVTPITPSTGDDFAFGGGNSGLPAIPPSKDNLIAFTQAKSSERKISNYNPYFGSKTSPVKENLLEKSEEELFRYFEEALELLTTGSQANEALNLLLIHFKENDGGPYLNVTLSSILDFGDGDAIGGRSIGQFMNSLKLRLCDKLKVLKGQCVGEINIDLTDLKYPNFPLSDPNLIAQLGGIQGVSAYVDGEGNISALLHDTFGVSEEDAVKRDRMFMNIETGGAIGTKAMRILQTHYGKKPFVHSVKIDPISMGESGFNLIDCN